MTQNLFDEFDEVSSKAWKQKIQYELKGADYNETLVWESLEGIKIKPFYHNDDLDNVALPKKVVSKVWKIGHEIFVGNPEKANQKALDVLQRGAESLIFNIPSENINIENLLFGIDLASVPLHFNLQFLSEEFAKQLLELTKISKTEIHLHMDIIGNLARTGNWFFDLKKDHTISEAIVSQFEPSKATTVLSIDVALYQNAGANIVQQLAYAMAHANEYLNHGLFEKLQSPVFKVSIGPNYFFEIAKLRALRILWRTLAGEYRISNDCHILATPSKRNKTLYDYNVNMLRTTSECMSAILGGADTINNLRYDAIYHKDNEFGERIARNQLLIMKNESYFDKVGNPADGAYYIETLTSQLAEKALDLFKSIESGGGFLKQLKEHTIQKKIKESAQKEQLLFDQKKEILVGTNAYQNADDGMKGATELYPFVKIDKRKTLIEPILEKRLAEVLEQERLSDE
ncbi:methylmalonyl-CoA mutase subunit beta [Maribacter halichondriae]|uniref:methylmalonyl-CoA mutase subunit beta n=1 Tax=Maribacter halichondriae TaxID=2980554 RepID=UPI002358E1DB|nr:methylmalonyl-CoA mutase subunit beta [Maribacter sp. Hal144]